ncbi:hypothetical protein [Streptomyces sp. NPDC051211]|uniref:hypothetical protein n=1 Tax=Streptomyces sp. NPDC051211 TaxID=3154643 RepID=UPI00344B02FA
MSELRRTHTTSRRGFLALLGGSALLLLPGAAGCSASGSDAEQPVEDHLRVRTDAEPLRKRFTGLGELSDPHWLGYDVDLAGDRVTIPGPDARIRLVGVAQLPKGAVAAVLRDAPPGDLFEPAELPADIPAPLAPHLPERSGWRASTAYDLRVLARDPAQPMSNDQADGQFFLHEGRDLVWFDTLFLET